jgi:hypothetical protein
MSVNSEGSHTRSEFLLFKAAMDEIDTLNRQHHDATQSLTKQLRNGDLSIDRYREKLASIDQDYHARIEPLIRAAQGNSWGREAKRRAGERVRTLNLEPF